MNMVPRIGFFRHPGRPGNRAGPSLVGPADGRRDLSRLADEAVGRFSSPLLQGCYAPSGSNTVDQPMNAKAIVSLAIAFDLLVASKSVERRGDLLSLADGRLTWHLVALALLVGALGCFIYAGMSAFRRNQ